MDAILLAGGFGTRLMPLTKTRPKPLIPLANVPFTARTIQWLRAAGIDHVILSLHYNVEQFVDFFSQLDLGVDISFAVEESPLGTGGAIKNCEQYLRSPRCFICNGDIFTNLHLARMLAAHLDARASVTIALTEVEDPSRFGVIETNDAGRIRSFTEKPSREQARSRDINAGIYIFERQIFEWFPQEPCSVEREIFPTLLRVGTPMLGYREWPYWTDLGTPQDYLQAHRDILAGTVPLPLAYHEITPGVWVGEQVAIAEDALIRPPVILGDGVAIAHGATVGPGVVLGAGVQVDADALIEDSVLWEGVRVHRDSIVRGCVVGCNSDLDGLVLDEICEDFGSRKCALQRTLREEMR